MEQPTFISPSIINYGPMADTDERRAVVRRLTDALTSFQIVREKYLSQLQKRMEQPEPSAE